MADVKHLIGLGIGLSPGSVAFFIRDGLSGSVVAAFTPSSIDLTGGYGPDIALTGQYAPDVALTGKV